MDYIGLLKRSAGIAWQYKRLWVFGFLVSLFGGGGRFTWSPTNDDMRQFRQMPQFVGWQITPGLIAAVVVAGIVLFILAVVVNMVSAGALIHSVREADAGRPVGLRRGFGAGFRRLWTYFWVNVVVGLPAAILSIGLILLAMSPAIVGAMATWGRMRDMWPLVIISVVLMIPVGFFLVLLYAVISLVLEFMLRACVLERLGVGASLSHGWDLFAKHFWQAVVIALLLFGCGILFAIVLVPLALGFVGVAFAAGGVVWAAARDWLAALIVGGVVFLPGLLVLLILHGAFKVFTSGVWTLAYTQMAALEQAPAALAPVSPETAVAEVATS